MANGIINTLNDKIFPAAAPGNQTGKDNLQALLFAPPVTKGEADAALNHITGQFVARQTSASQTVAVQKTGDDETKKTVSDFYQAVWNNSRLMPKILPKRK